MALRGHNFQLTAPTIVLNSDAAELGSTKRNLGEYITQYVNTPQVTKPCTITITPGTPGNVLHYTWGPQYPTHRVDRINCFVYSAPIVLTNNKSQDGTTIYVAEFSPDAAGNAAPNDQSPVVIAKFFIDLV